MSKFDTSEWKEISFKDLFENIKQGARLKSADHIKGNLPFVMAGNINLGISGYIGNENVRKFNANAITIDIFGNTFYRDYEFGASDDVGVFWNDKNQFSDNAMIFIASVISKFMQGKFDFANKLRASQTYDFKIKLPVKQNGEIDFEYMETTIKNTKFQMQNILNAYKSLIQREKERERERKRKKEKERKRERE